MAVKCPYCQMTIDERAIKCPHCHSYIIERRKSFRRLFVNSGLNLISTFVGVFLALSLILLIVFNYYGKFQEKYDVKSRVECRANVVFLDEALSFYETMKGEPITKLDKNSVKAISDIIGEKDFHLPVCPLGGEYEIYEKNSVRCSIHGDGL
ncbi:MAG: hypothetical protein C0601_12145 [Candidatus Muiribacterium halophilum]|uniref:Uncharacterized protein n=1 Tax=Muiribacterium halophilum TaxID=2053465 RepID=A0A2N5ZAL7_MUIH1|nr:MAG: hypothetical protein C0601_12145 [Candidatus Muirbacterium halophilum]